MTEEKNIYNRKTELALSAIMFFSPLIKNKIRKDSTITNDDKDFLTGFIKLGYFNILTLFIAIALQIIFYLTQFSVFQTISFILSIILAISLVFGSIYAISNKNILRNTVQESLVKKDFNKLDLILKYIPLYNIYLRYQKHEFENPDLIIKESIIWWLVFVFFMIIFQNPIINRVIIITIIVRIISILNNIDLGLKAKEILNGLFKKNPEELRGYISGTILTIFNNNNLKANISKQKNKLELLFKFDHKQILLEYVLFFIISVIFVYQGYKYENPYIITFLLFIVLRYLLMIFKRKRVPHIPILYEMTNLFFKNKI